MEIHISESLKTDYEFENESLRGQIEINLSERLIILCENDI
jgi:hypothetical protein